MPEAQHPRMMRYQSNQRHECDTHILDTVEKIGRLACSELNSTARALRPVETNVVERAIRPDILTRSNALFADSDGGARHWAIAATLIQTAKLNGVDPMAWLRRRARTHGLGPHQNQ
jgi:hypothetical protein